MARLSPSIAGELKMQAMVPSSGLFKLFAVHLRFSESGSSVLLASIEIQCDFGVRGKVGGGPRKNAFILSVHLTHFHA